MGEAASLAAREVVESLPAVNRCVRVVESWPARDHTHDHTDRRSVPYSTWYRTAAIFPHVDPAMPMGSNSHLPMNELVPHVHTPHVDVYVTFSHTQRLAFRVEVCWQRTWLQVGARVDNVVCKAVE